MRKSVWWLDINAITIASGVDLYSYLPDPEGWESVFSKSDVSRARMHFTMPKSGCKKNKNSK
jgi:hypothetical protein